MATLGTLPGALILTGMEGAGDQLLIITDAKRNTCVQKNKRVKVL